MCFILKREPHADCFSQVQVCHHLFYVPSSAWICVSRWEEAVKGAAGSSSELDSGHWLQGVFEGADVTIRRAVEGVAPVLASRVHPLPPPPPPPLSSSSSCQPQPLWTLDIGCNAFLRAPKSPYIRLSRVVSMFLPLRYIAPPPPPPPSCPQREVPAVAAFLKNWCLSNGCKALSRALVSPSTKLSSLYPL